MCHEHTASKYHPRKVFMATQAVQAFPVNNVISNICQTVMFATLITKPLLRYSVSTRVSKSLQIFQYMVIVHINLHRNYSTLLTCVSVRLFTFQSLCSWYWYSWLPPPPTYFQRSRCMIDQLLEYPIREINETTHIPWNVFNMTVHREARL
jgi:hypothetical protein